MSELPLAARVVEVIADLGETAHPRYRYGSGCVVAGRTVLTAAHVVKGAVSVKVRDSGKFMHEAALDPAFVGDVDGPGPDLALVEITDPKVDMPNMGLAAVNRDSKAGDPVERCHVIGYPAFMERKAPDGARFRETADALGHVPVLSGLAGGLLSVQVSDAPRPLPDEQAALGDSQWSGMSGAPVVADGLLLGVVSEHAQREGSSAITAIPLTALDADPARPGWGPGVVNPGAWWARLGVPSACALQQLPSPREERRPCVVVIGAANEEYILLAPDGWEVGQKYIADSRSYLGGSGVNYARRLLRYGKCIAIPIIPVGDDTAGHHIRDAILEDLIHFRLYQAFRHDLRDDGPFFVSNSRTQKPTFRTQRSTILVGGETRTIFTEHRDPHEVGKFTDYLLYEQEGRLASLPRHLDEARLDVVGVVIGHILSDSIEVGGGNEEEGAGACTKAIIRQAKKSGAFIFANPGESQIRRGKEFWEKEFEQLDVLQLNLNEIKLLFDQEKDTPLLEIVEWLADRHITTVITLDKLGAICVCYQGPKQVEVKYKYREVRIVIALPLQIEDIKDTTGAGDAFGAAIVNQLLLKRVKNPAETPKALTPNTWSEILEEARFWAAYACTKLGGAEGCPSKDKLEEYKEKIQDKKHYLSWVDVKRKNDAESILFLLDRAYSSVQN